MYGKINANGTILIVNMSNADVVGLSRTSLFCVELPSFIYHTLGTLLTICLCTKASVLVKVSLPRYSK